MNTQGQLGLFAPVPITSEMPALKKPQSVEKVSLEISFKQGSLGVDINRILDDFIKEVAKLDGEVNMNTKTSALSWFEESFVALDVETTGLDAAGCRVIELAIVPFNMPNQTPFSQLFSLSEKLPKEIIAITGIDDSMLEGQPSFKDKASEIVEELEKARFILAYNAKFDRSFVESELARAGMVLPDLPWIDPFIFISEIDRFKKGKKLVDSAKRWGVELTNAHRALDDARAAGELMLKLVNNIEAKTLPELIRQQKIIGWQNAHSMAEYKKANTWSVHR